MPGLKGMDLKGLDLRWKPPAPPTGRPQDQPIPDNYVRLDNGELVSKATFGNLTKEQQAYLMKHGVNAFNKWHDANVAAFKQGYIKLNTGEWISREMYESLSAEDKAYLQEHGVEALNKLSKDKAEAFKLTHIQLKTGEWMRRVDFDKLSPEDQEFLVLTDPMDEEMKNW